MNVVQLMSQLESRGVRLWADGELLRFKAPKGALVDPLKAQLRARKAEILDFLRVVQAPSGNGTPPIERTARDGRLALSFAQERLWFIDRWQPGQATYNIADAVRLRGRLDVAAARRSLAEIARRHESLRTTFAARDGEPYQVIAEGWRPDLSIVDLSATTNGAAAVEKLSAMLADQPFDLERGPLMRACLLRVAADEHVLVFVLHHIISDGWSTGLLIYELSALYAAETRAVETRAAETRATAKHSQATGPRAGNGAAVEALPTLPIQYADYAAWQRQWLEGQVMERQLDYWKEQLAGSHGALDLPTDRPRPPVQTFRGALHRFRLPAGTMAACDRLAAGGVTRFMVLLAAFSALLHRVTGAKDVSIGSPTANRGRTELESLIGFFVNVVTLRQRLAPGTPFRQLVEWSRATALDAFANQDVPFEKLVEELRPTRDPSRPPLFQVVFALQNAPAAALEAPGLTLEPVQFEHSTAKFDLTLNVTDQPSGPVELAAELEYNTDLFDATTTVRLARLFVHLLDAATSSPDAAIEHLPLLDASQRHQLLADWNDTDQPGLDEMVVSQLFARQVERRPDAIALTDPLGNLTYGELARRAQRIAGTLHACGLTPEQPVALLCERSSETVAAILGVLEAGGFYVPLDVSHPDTRLAYILEDLEVELAICQPAQRERLAALPGGESRQILSLGSNGIATGVDPEQLASVGKRSPHPGRARPDRSPDQLVCVMYTSGSTGQPKGVGIRNRGVARLLFETDYLEFGPNITWSHYASLAFDGSTFEIWSALLHGSRLSILPPGALSLHEISRELAEQRVHSLFMTTGLFHQLVEQGLGALRAVRQMLPGGDVLSPAHAVRVMAELPDLRLVNGYGPTELTCIISTESLRDARADRPVPVGRAIAGTRAMVVSQAGELQPIGVAGELLASGQGLARGYVGRPRLTAERFAPDPFSGRPGRRLYRTGDMARWLADGRLDFAGRSDHQVKLRGFRIELGEIETALNALPEVAESVVAVDGEGHAKRLVAWISGDGEAAPSADQLSRALRDELPGYMVPTVFTTLDAFPLTSNGKIDRRALRELLPAAGTRRSRPATAPRTPVEEALVEIWRDILELDEVGVEDDFFDLGGHSLLATRVVARIAKDLRVDLPLRALFDAPNLAGLAHRVEAAFATGQTALSPLEPVDPTAPQPLSFAQERLWLFEQLHPGTAAYNTYRAGRVHGPFDVPAAHRTLNALVARHEAFRTRYTTVDGEAVQVIDPPPAMELPIVDLSRLPDDLRQLTVLELGNAEGQRVFDLERSPLLFAFLIRLAEEDHVFVLSIHHIAFDLGSGGLVLGEIEELYSAFHERREPDLPPLPVRYVDFAAWQRGWVAGEVLERELEYWREQLTGSMPARLPSDRPRGRPSSGRGGDAYPRMSRAFTDRVKDFARREKATLFMVLKAAFDAVLCRTSGVSDLALATSITNRNRPELERVVGFFDNVIVLRVRFSRHDTLRQLLAEVRDVALAAYARPNLPFTALVEALGRGQGQQSGGSQQPLFDMMFLYMLNYPSMYTELAGLQVVPYQLHNDTAKFEMSIAFRELADGFYGDIEYDADLFDRTTIARFLDSYQLLLRAMVDEPESRLADVPLLDRAARHQLTTEWNEPAIEPGDDAADREADLFALFLAQADRFSGRDAVRCGGSCLTYEQLASVSTQLARQLVELGVRRGDRVALCVERSPEQIVGWLGILGAGAAVVPIDPAYPTARREYLLTDAKVAILVSDQATSERLETANAGCRLVLVEPEATSSEIEPPIRRISGHDLAYVIYTSGSTGQPKGVMVRHGAVVRLARWLQREIYEDRPQVVSVNGPLAFDTSVKQLVQLFEGHTLEIVPQDVRLDADAFIAFLETHSVDVLDATPSQLQTLIAAGLLDQPASRRPGTVLLGGEAVTPALWRQLAATEGRFFNLYGPTECTVDATCSRIAGSTPSLGRPISHAEAHVLDPELRPVAAGVPAELCLGGDGLAQGYLGAPRRTAETFVPHPDRGYPEGRYAGARLYRTGDRVRHLKDGRLDFLGRLDYQVKVRGHRVELGEVEAALASHPDLRAAAAAVRPLDGDARLVGYLVPVTSTAAPEPDALHRHLAGLLPEAMLPSAWVVLEELPLTTHGKVDRNALPNPAWEEAATGTPYVAPHGAVEEKLAKLWSDVLGVARVGAQDSFFALGGHSLLLTRMISRVRTELRAEIALADFMPAPTVSSLAEQLTTFRAAASSASASDQPMVEASSCLVPLRAHGKRSPLFLVHAADGDATAFLPLVSALDEDQPVYGLQAPGLADAGSEVPHKTLSDLASHYVDEICRAQPQGPYRLGGWSMGGVIALEMARQLETAGRHVDFVALLDSVPHPVEDPELAGLEGPLQQLAAFGSALGLDGPALRSLASGLASLDEADLLSELAMRASAAGRLPRGVDSVDLQRRLAVYEAHLAAWTDHELASIVAPRVLFAAGDEDARTRSQTWLATGVPVEVQPVSGDHHSILRPPAVTALAAALGELLKAPPER
ncbi:MAG: amino acid adenylation domain-containing protein [Acidobacteriota bacterium]